LYNDNGELIIITPHKILPPPHIQLCNNNDNDIINNNINNNISDFLLIICPHNNSAVYKLKTYYQKNITLIINKERVDTYVNTYPEFSNEIIMTTVVKNEDNLNKLNRGLNKTELIDDTIITKTYTLKNLTLNDI